jgi:energy-coupling factor transport system substrate-specific component
MGSKLAKTAMFVALGVAVGYLLAGVPNIEGISAVSFCSGYLLGRAPGSVVGAVSMLLFSGFNPLGPPVPPVLGAQVAVMALIGASGDLWRRLAGRLGKAEILAGGFGAILTLGYSVAADYGFAVSVGRWKDPLPVIAAGLPFSILHIVSNALIFAGVGAFLIRRYGERLKGV